ncbi:MAG: YybH family protein [Gemmatimonadota bacterium]
MRKNLRLTQAEIDRARKILGKQTETELAVAPITSFVDILVPVSPEETRHPKFGTLTSAPELRKPETALLRSRAAALEQAYCVAYTVSTIPILEVFMRCSYLVIGILLSACGAAANPEVDVMAEEQAIRELNRQWSSAATSRDIEKALTFYAPGGAALWPESPLATGTDALRALWKKGLDTPGLASLAFVSEKITIAASGELAVDQGRVEVGLDTPEGQITFLEKYITVWKKVDGQWKALYDMYNTNEPPAPAAQQ